MQVLVEVDEELQVEQQRRASTLQEDFEFEHQVSGSQAEFSAERSTALGAEHDDADSGFL